MHKTLLMIAALSLATVPAFAYDGGYRTQAEPTQYQLAGVTPVAETSGQADHTRAAEPGEMVSDSGMPSGVGTQYQLAEDNTAAPTPGEMVS